MAATASAIVANRTKETSSTTGTGTIDLLGAATGFRSFVDGVGGGNTCYYVIEDGVDWEVGIGTVTDAATDTLSRDTVIGSSNGGALVNWGAGLRDVFCSLVGDEGGGFKAFDVEFDADVEMTLGRATVGGGLSDHLTLSHVDQAGLTSFALDQGPTGSTTLNAPAGSGLDFTLGLVRQGTCSSTGLWGFGGSGAPQTEFHIFSDAPVIRVSDMDAGTDTAVNTFFEWYRGLSTSRVGWFGYGSALDETLTLANESAGGTIDFWAGGSPRFAIDNTGAITASADADQAFTLGRAKLASPTTDVMNLAHVDNSNTTDYAIRQTAAGATTVNAKTGQTVVFGINGSTVGRFSATGQFAVGSHTPINKFSCNAGGVFGSTYAGTVTAPTNGLAVEGRSIFGSTFTAQARCVSDANAAWSTAAGNSNHPDSFLVANLGATQGDGNIGASIGFCHLGNAVTRRAAIAAYQGAPDPDVVGLTFWVHPSSGGSDPIEEAMRITPTKRVGIGLTAPLNLLGVKGACVFGSTYAGTVTAPTDGAAIEGNVVIGATSASSRLHVTGSSGIREVILPLAVTGQTLINSKITEVNGQSCRWTAAVSAATISSSTVFADIIATITQADPSTLKGSLAFRTNAGDSLLTSMTILDSGLVGIGLTAPLNRLGVSGACAIGANIAGVVTADTNGLVVEGTIRKHGASGGSAAIKIATTTKTTNSGTGTETISAIVPAGAVVLGVTARVTTILAGAALTTWRLGVAADTDLYGATLALASGTVANHTTWTASPFLNHTWSASASNIVITANAGQFDSGVVRVVVYYIDTVAPTS